MRLAGCSTERKQARLVEGIDQLLGGNAGTNCHGSLLIGNRADSVYGGDGVAGVVKGRRPVHGGGEGGEDVCALEVADIEP
jgi:hypothetical protein